MTICEEYKSFSFQEIFDECSNASCAIEISVINDDLEVPPSFYSALADWKSNSVYALDTTLEQALDDEM